MLTQEDIRQVGDITKKIEDAIEDVDLLIDRLRRSDDGLRVRSLRNIRGMLTNTHAAVEGLFR